LPASGSEKTCITVSMSSHRDPQPQGPAGGPSLVGRPHTPGVCARPKAYLRGDIRERHAGAAELRFPWPTSASWKNILEPCAHYLFGEHLATQASPRLPAAAAAAVPHQAGEGGGSGSPNAHPYPGGAPAAQRQPFTGRPVLGMDRKHAVAEDEETSAERSMTYKKAVHCVFATWPVFFYKLVGLQMIMGSRLQIDSVDAQMRCRYVA